MEINKLFDLTGKTAIITGGGRGLGEQIAYVLGEAGANIVICSRKLTACKEVSNSLNEKGIRSLALECDVTKPEDIDHVVQRAIDEFGTIDVLVNNSGASWGAPALEMPIEAWDKVMDVNVKAVFLFSQKVGKIMVEQGSGKIINIASVTGFGGQDPELMDAIGYTTSKGAVIAFTKDLAVKLAPHNIHVNAIAPGFFPTKMAKGVLDVAGEKVLARTPAGRFGSDYEMRGAALFLAARASDYVYGHTLVVDGGVRAGLMY